MMATQCAGPTAGIASVLALLCVVSLPSNDDVGPEISGETRELASGGVIGVLVEGPAGVFLVIMGGGPGVDGVPIGRVVVVVDDVVVPVEGGPGVDGVIGTVVVVEEGSGIVVIVVVVFRVSVVELACVVVEN